MQEKRAVVGFLQQRMLEDYEQLKRDKYDYRKIGHLGAKINITNSKDSVSQISHFIQNYHTRQTHDRIIYSTLTDSQRNSLKKSVRKLK